MAKKLESLNELEPLASMFGNDSDEFQLFLPEKHIGKPVAIGECPSEYCVELTPMDITRHPSLEEGKPPALTVVRFDLNGRWGNLTFSPATEPLPLPLYVGCYLRFASGLHDLVLLVVDESPPKMAIGYKPGTAQSLFEPTTDCPKESGATTTLRVY